MHYLASPILCELTVNRLCNHVRCNCATQGTLVCPVSHHPRVFGRPAGAGRLTGRPAPDRLPLPAHGPGQAGPAYGRTRLRPDPLTAGPAYGRTRLRPDPLTGWLRLQAGRGAQLLGAVRALPGEVRLVPAEVAERRRLRVDRAQQVQGGDDRPRPQVEDFGDRVLDPLYRHLLGAEALHEQPDRL